MSLIRQPALWTVNELAERLGAASPGTGEGAIPVSRFVTAALQAKPGDVYVPVAAAPSEIDANVSRATAAGAVAVVLTDRHRVASQGAVIRVPNLRAALQELADAARASFNGRVVGVTGSVGKTTTKDMLAHLLAHEGLTHFTDANLNSTESNLASVASLPRSADFSVLEIAMTDPRSISRKSRVAKPDVALITGIGFSHGSHHTSGQESILRTKTDMFWHVTDAGAVVLPSQDPNFPALCQRARESGRVGRMITCGTRAQDTVKLLECISHATYSEVSIEADGQRFRYVVAQPGAHFVQNSLLAAGAMLAVGASLKHLGALATFAPTRRRVERFRVPLGDGAIELIDDGYNAAPDSVRALLAILRERSKARRRVLVFGDMLELGEREEEHHLALASDIESSNVDLLVTVGPNTAKLAEKVRTRSVSFASAAAAAGRVPRLLESGDLVAVKGSNAMKLIRVVNALKGTAPLSRQGMHWSIEVETGPATDV